MKAHIFLIANLKFRLQTPCIFGDMAENVKLIGIPINNFLCIYIIASSPGLHTLFCLWRVNKKLPQGETSQNTFQRSRSISWKCKIHRVKWAHPPLSMFNKNWWFLNFQKEFLNFSFCIRKLAVAFYMINEIQPKIKFQNIVQCPFNVMFPRD